MAHREIARIAERQHGNVTRAQLLDAGLSAEEIRQRLRSGVLLREFPGVYRVGHRAPSVHARYTAAVLACGEGALLSGRAAGHLLGLLKGPAPPPEVKAPRERRIPGLVTHRIRATPALDATTSYGIATTSVPQTLVDLAAHLSLDALARACHEAGVKHRTTPARVERVLARRPASKGAANLRKVLRGEARVTLSRLEKRFLTLLEQHGLPLPETNRPAGGRRVDCRWPKQRLTVELDSYAFHNSRHAWEQDRRREREAHSRGDEFRRYTWGDVAEDDRLLLNELRHLVGKAGRQGSLAPGVPPAEDIPFED
jgi:very-short-patch-repair endonuclease